VPAGTLIVTADHGNVEQMVSDTGQYKTHLQRAIACAFFREPTILFYPSHLSTGEPHTAHTLNPVPFLISGLENSCAAGGSSSLQNGSLPDIAPTMCTLLGIQQPKEMTGKSLLL